VKGGASFVFVLTIVPVAFVIVPYLWVLNWLAERAYSVLYSSVATAGRLRDESAGKSGKPLLLVAAIAVVIGLILQGAGMVAG